MSKSSRSVVYHRQLPQYLYNFQKGWKIPRIFLKGHFLTRKILNLGEYCICWNVILKFILFILQTCVEVAKVNYRCISGKRYPSVLCSCRSDTRPLLVPRVLTPDNLRRLRLVFFNDVFLQRFVWVSSSLAFFVLWVSCFFFVAGVNFLHDFRTWARVTHVVADKLKREERIVCFVKTNDCRVC